ncbi:hypothetical protein FG167_09905 [Lacinutrix sp. WUR7]|uniref:hypothetical protein n=1 Tax=Lacinutrix sp. WUR7 TaxID=2653681 RepID=UPI00193D1A7B|nr:hypothetical protein [Lacinutrix sp. WUR7]QRM89530.1 hypothetical protein FG167_09905 [Lacinutrix sp. WUR7]
MINIRTNQTGHALKLHQDGLKGEIVARAKRIYKNHKNSMGRIPFRRLIVFLEENESRILVSELPAVIGIQQQLFHEFGDSSDLRSDLENIINYKWFRKYKKGKHDGFKLAKALSIDVCPYCNRNYTTSHNIEGTTKNVFPEFDHYYPQRRYPLLALSFYNLIPSCNVCNTHFKGDDDPNDAEHNIFYPYSTLNPVKHFNFDFSPLDYSSLIGKSTNFDTSINTLKYTSSKDIKDLVEGSLDYFNIVGTYNANHKGLIKALINKRVNHSNSYMKSLFDNYGITREEAYHILFESYYEDEKLLKRPLSKLKKDIFNEIESLS